MGAEHSPRRPAPCSSTRALRDPRTMSSASTSPFSDVSSLPSSPDSSVSSIDDFDAKRARSLPAEEPQDHHYFAFNDDNVTFLVENTLFTIHKYFFCRDSAVFRQMFYLPPPVGQQVEGMSRDNPIRLFGVTTLDFERFLKVLYPPLIGIDALSTSEEWASVLNVADRFAFNSVRELAIRKLLVVASPVEKVVLGHRYLERRLLIPGYMALVSRYSALTLDEAVCLGMADVVLISQAREAIRDGDYTYSGEIPVERLFAGRLPPPSAPE